MYEYFSDESNQYNDSFQNYNSLDPQENNMNIFDIKNNIFPIIPKFNKGHHLIQEEKTTAFKTNNKDYFYNDLTQSINNEVKNNMAPFFSMDNIIEIMDKEKLIDLEIINQIIEGKVYIENFDDYEYMEFTKRKRKRQDYSFKDFNVNVEKENKRGRKTNKSGRNKHDKNKSDNIIKKIKAILFKSSLTFMNNILNMNKEKKLLKLDYYKYVNKLKKENDLNLLKMTLKDFFSQEISKKYKTKESPEHNKIIIDNLINDIMAEKEENIKDNINYKTIMFIFNITFEDFIDIYTYKKSLDDLLNDYKINKNEIDYMRIKNNIRGINDISKDITKKNEGKYFSLFIFYLYNYKRWFYLRKCRNLPLDEKK